MKAHAESFDSRVPIKATPSCLAQTGIGKIEMKFWATGIPPGAVGASLGIVAKQLNDDGYPVLDLDQDEINTKDLVKGRNAKESLEYLFSLEESDSKAVYPNANGLLKIDPDTGNYMYSSYENFASYFEEENTFKVYEKPAVVGGGSKQDNFSRSISLSQVFTIDDTNGFQEKVMKDAEGNTVDKNGNPYPAGQGWARRLLHTTILA